MDTWVILSYDVWGNEEDGFEINDTFSVGSLELEDDEQYDDSVLVEKLIEAELLAEDARPEDFAFDGDEFHVFIADADTGRPIFGLRRDVE